MLRDRRQALAAALAGLEAEGAHLQARGEMGTLDVAMFRRRAMQLEAELRWHDEFDRVLASLPEPEGQPAAEGLTGSGVAEGVAPSAAPGAETRRRNPGRDQHAGRGRGTKKRRET